MILEYIILGIVQGIAEWLPISSEGVLVLLQARFLEDVGGFEMIQLAIFLHLGTFFAVLIYFKKDIIRLLKAIFKYKKETRENKNILNFLFYTALISGLVGGLFLFAIKYIDANIELGGKAITIIIGFLLLATAFIMLRARQGGLRRAEDIKRSDIILLGAVQGLAALPGFSRSGLTVSTLLLKKFDDEFALRLSFLMSLPIVLIGNIALGLLDLGSFVFGWNVLLGLLFSFIFGLLTIHILLKIAKKIKFGYFVLIFGLLAIISAFI